MNIVSQQYRKHVVKCAEGRGRHVYPGGFHKQALGIKEKLESIGIMLPEDLCYYDSFICYDFEALFKQLNKHTQCTTFTNKHIPVSYTLCDDAGHTRSHLSDDPKQLIQNFIKDLLTLRKQIVLELTED